MKTFDIDPYKVLGVGRDAGLEEVKSAYRRLVRVCHPDICGKNLKNIKRFLAIKDAYQLLKQKLQRKDKVSIVSPGSLKRPAPNNASIEGTFLFVEIGMRQALYGTRVAVEIDGAEDFCQRCKGLGKTAASKPSPCRSCLGKGYRVVNWGKGDLKIICSKCSGSGNSELETCPECGGRGIITKKKRIQLEIPPGTRDGTILQVEAARGSKGSSAAPVFVEIDVKTPPGWIIHGKDIISSIDIDCWTRLGGGYIEVETIEGKEKVFISPGLGGEKFIKIENRGWVDSEGRRGHHLIRLNVLSPKGPCPIEAQKLIQILKGLWPCGNEGPKGLPGPFTRGKEGQNPK